MLKILKLNPKKLTPLRKYLHFPILPRVEILKLHPTQKEPQLKFSQPHQIAKEHRRMRSHRDIGSELDDQERLLSEELDVPEFVANHRRFQPQDRQ